MGVTVCLVLFMHRDHSTLSIMWPTPILRNTNAHIRHRRVAASFNKRAPGNTGELPQFVYGCAWPGVPELVSRREFPRPRQVRRNAYDESMSASMDTIVAEAVQLPPDQRLTLAHRILSSLDPERSTETEAEWDREICDRIARFDAGQVKSIPASEVFAELDRRLRR
jgi:putative addiction module component (TIGR02574 family)